MKKRTKPIKSSSIYMMGYKDALERTANRLTREAVERSMRHMTWKQVIVGFLMGPEFTAQRREFDLLSDLADELRKKSDNLENDMP